MNWRVWKKAPSWRALRALNVGLLVVCIGFALIQDNRWLMMIDAFIAGTALSGVFHATQMIRMMASFDRIKEAFQNMCDINKALVENRVQMVVERMVIDPDDAPIVPTTRH